MIDWLRRALFYPINHKEWLNIKSLETGALIDLRYKKCVLIYVVKYTYLFKTYKFTGSRWSNFLKSNDILIDNGSELNLVYF